MSRGFAPGDIAIAVCDRCKRKRPYTALGPDPNFHGLRVCQDPYPGLLGSCGDQFDPYRLPARQTEAIAMRFPRPDAHISTRSAIFLTIDPSVSNPTVVTGAPLMTENGCWIMISVGS